MYHNFLIALFSPFQERVDLNSPPQLPIPVGGLYDRTYCSNFSNQVLTKSYESEAIRGCNEKNPTETPPPPPLPPVVKSWM